MRNTLKKHGLKCYKKIKKPSLTSIQIKKRLKFAKTYKKFNYNNWASILFSDESKFNLHGSDNGTMVWCRETERYKQENIKEMKKFGVETL